MTSVRPELDEPPGLRAVQQALLADLGLLEAPDDDELDAVTRLASSITGYPTAMLNALQAAQACQLSRVGIDRVHMVREESLCHRASLGGGVVVSGDCATDPRFADLPWVDGRLGRVRRYAMAPLEVDGTVVGTLCVLDVDPGPALGELAQQQLADLAALAAELLERRRSSRRAEEARAELTEAHAEVVRRRAFDRALLEALPVGIVVAGPDGRVELFNDVTRRWHGTEADDSLDPEALPAAYDLFEPDGETPLVTERVPLQRVISEGSISGVEIVIRPLGQLSRTVECTGGPIRDADGRLLGALVAMADVTRQRALEDRLRTAATHDVLTGLPNRGLLVDRLDAAFAGSEEAQEPLAVFYGDLDGFKAVNDAHGHAAGDAVLVETAARLSGAVSRRDTVARLGGDEFVVLCPGVPTAQAAQAIARRLAAAVGAPVVVDGVEHRVGISIGTELSTSHASADELLRAADAAMYAAKRARRAVRAALAH